MELLTSAQMRAADRIAIEDMKIPGLTLMENAGRAVADETSALLKKIRRSGSLVAVVCGKGNNGGDGMVAARILARRGFRCRVFLLGRNLSPDAAIQRKRLPKRGVEVIDASSPALWKKHRARAADCAALVDALFGTGMSGRLKDPYPAVIRDLNDFAKPIVAVDIPSGIDSDTGSVLGAAVRAHTTVSFARPKIGHILHPGAEFTGRLVIADIGIPRAAIAQVRPDTFLLDARAASGLLPRRSANSHKGDYGRSVILAGSRGMTGAAVLAAESAMRIGSGLTVLCVPAAVHSIAAKKLAAEAMCRPAPDRGRGFFSSASMAVVRRIVSRADSVLVGPGIGRDPRTVRWVRDLLKIIPPSARLVLDADALVAIGAFSALKLKRETVITPHAGEMAALADMSRPAVESNACGVARAVARRMGVTVALKGSRTVIASSDGTVHVNVTGNSALAKGGSGDVLAGMICGLCAQGLTAHSAAQLAVYLHGSAADLLVESGRDKRTVLASDLYSKFDEALLELRTGQTRRTVNSAGPQAGRRRR